MMTMSERGYGYKVTASKAGATSTDCLQVFNVTFTEPVLLTDIRSQVQRLPLLKDHRIMDVKIFTNHAHST